MNQLNQMNQWGGSPRHPGQSSIGKSWHREAGRQRFGNDQTRETIHARHSGLAQKVRRNLWASQKPWKFMHSRVLLRTRKGNVSLCFCMVPRPRHARTRDRTGAPLKSLRNHCQQQLVALFTSASRPEGGRGVHWGPCKPVHNGWPKIAWTG